MISESSGVVNSLMDTCPYVHKKMSSKSGQDEIRDLAFTAHAVLEGKVRCSKEEVKDADCIITIHSIIC